MGLSRFKGELDAVVRNMEPVPYGGRADTLAQPDVC